MTSLCSRNPELLKEGSLINALREDLREVAPKQICFTVLRRRNSAHELGWGRVVSASLAEEVSWARWKKKATWRYLAKAQRGRLKQGQTGPDCESH